MRCITPRGALMVGAVFAALGLLLGAAHAQSRERLMPSRPDSAWLKAARYGVFFHFLPGGPGWEREVDAFDVEAFALQMEQAGAAYVFVTLGQNNGYYCSPNR